jgi:hypothetical protein
MAGIQAADIADIAVSTLRNLGRHRVTDVQSTYQNTTIFKRLWKKNKLTFSGDQAQFNLITDESHTARSVGLYYTANVAPTNVLTTGVMPWRHVHWDYGIDRILDIFKVQRWAALASGILFMERKGWQVAPSTSDDFMGIPGWIVKSNTAVTTNDGFNGSLPSGYTTVAGIDPTSVKIAPKWNNYGTQYTNVSKDDAVIKLERLLDYTDFMPLVDELPTYNEGDDYGLYTTYTVKQQFKQLLEAQNDDLGFDLDPTNGHMMFRRGPVTWVKQLENDTTNPIYAINWGEFHFIVLRGEMMKEVVFPQLPNQPTTMAVHVDSSLNTYCTNRRRQGILSTDTTMPANM